MKKKFLSLALTLALCLSLSVPALAYNNLFEVWEDDYLNVYDNGSGDGWSYDSEHNDPGILKLSGAQNLEVYFAGSCIIELVPGTKSSLSMPLVDEWNLDGSVPTLTFRGTGELDIFGNPEAEDRGALSGFFSSIKLEDGLVMTGGAKQGDSYPATLGPIIDTHENGFYVRTIQANGKAAQYIHIGPANGSSAPAASGSFTDVAATSPYAEAINWAVEKGITNGISPTTFGPGNTCTVSHILTFLWRANGRPNESGTEKESVAAWAKGLGINTSNLSAPCTRAMAVSYMWKVAGSPAPTKASSFADVSASADYAKAVSWAVEQGITNGTGGDTFSPGGTCTRGQIVTFLYRASK